MPGSSASSLLYPAFQSLPSILSGILQRRSAGGATDDLLKGITDATGTIQGGSDKALDIFKQIYGDQMGFLEPYIRSGRISLQQLQDAMGPGGDLSKGYDFKPWDKTFTPPTGDDVLNEPGYKFGLDQGIQAKNRSFAANGNFGSGSRGTALERYATDYASTKYQDVYNRARDQYLTDYGIFSNERNAGEQNFRQNQADEFSRLFGLSEAGQNAAGTAAAAAGQYGAQVGATTRATSSDIASLQVAAARARAAGDQQKANALQGILDNVQQTGLFDQASKLLLQKLGIGPKGGPVDFSNPQQAVDDFTRIFGGDGIPLASDGPGTGGFSGAGAGGGGTYSGIQGGLSSAGHQLLAGLSGAGHGLTSAMSFLATNPYGWGIDAAIGTALIVNHFVGQGRKAATAFVNDPAHGQKLLNDTLGQIAELGKTDPKIAGQALQKAWTDFYNFAQDQIAKGGNKAKVAKQALFNTPNLTNTVRTMSQQLGVTLPGIS